ncbi:tape measure protein [Fibrobacter sp.]|uniref:tape measure protein n=1 Tax=Fibrobacter sp. TaxID=35828 RepID=UPI00388FA275
MATQVGEAIIKLTFDGKDVKAELNKVESQVEKTGKSTGNKWASAWTVAAGNLIAKGVSKIASTVSNTMDGAINRLDILNNFPKVMTSLGYSADEANKSVSTMSDALDGLPTSLDAMTSDVQKLAATMGNLASGEVNATSVGLALNDMFLAGGKGTEAASRAMEQYNQMLSQGRVDMQSWRSIVNAAPGQLDQLSKALLGANANQADLYQALQDGLVTFDDFNAAIVKLDKEGGEGFASLYDQAVAGTGGIATQLQNVTNTMNKIVAAALAGNTEDMAKYTDQLVQRVSAVAPTLIQGFSNAFVALLQALPGIITGLMPVITSGMQSLLQGTLQQLPAIISALTAALPDVILAVVNFLTDPANIGLIIESAIALFMGIVQAVPQILGGLLQAFGNLVGNMWNWITQRFGQFAADFGNFIGGIFKGAVNGVLTFIEGFINAPIDLLNGFLGLINDAFGWIGVHIDSIPRINLPRLAQGGVVDSATTAIIGEAGTEAVIPLENNTGNWAGLLASTLAEEMEVQGNGREINVYMNNNINNRLDAEEIGSLMIQSIRRAA